MHTGAKLFRRNSKKGVYIPDAPTNEEQTSLEVFAKPSSLDVSATVYACEGEHVCKGWTECKHLTNVPTDQVYSFWHSVGTCAVCAEGSQCWTPQGHRVWSLRGFASGS